MDAFTGFKVLGADKAVVLQLASPLLESRWKDAIASGATWDFDGYQPHVTLFYLGADYSGGDWRDGNYPPLPNFPLMLAAEVSGSIHDDVFSDDAPEWYTSPGILKRTAADTLAFNAQLRDG